MHRMLMPLCVLSLLIPSVSARQQYMSEASAISEFPFEDWPVRSTELIGLRAKKAAAALKSAPDRAATLDLLLKSGRRGDALDVLRRIVEGRPQEMQKAFAAIGYEGREMGADKAHDHAERLLALVHAAKARLASLPRDEAAAVARALVDVETELAMQPDSWRRRLRTFIAEYSGTPEALLAEVDVLSDPSGPEKIAALEPFIREHPGTIAAAKAWYLIGFDLAHNRFSYGERDGADPTDRFLRVVEIVKDLRSGRYPACEWTEKALTLVVEFHSYKASYTSANVERTLAAYDQLLPAILEQFEHGPQDGLASFIESGLGPVFRAKGDTLAGIEGLFGELEKMARRPDRVRLERANVYLRPFSEIIDTSERPALHAKGIAVLEGLVKTASGFERRKALAVLATWKFRTGDDVGARVLYGQYVADYPDSPYAWVAAMRAAQSDETADPARAAAAFRAVAERHAANPLARVLGRAHAGRAHEAANEFREALADYRAALSGWDRDYGDRYWFQSSRRTPSDDPLPPDPSVMMRNEITREMVTAQIENLEAALSEPDGESIALSRWLIAQGRWAEAAAEAAEFVGRHPASPRAADARLLSRRARLESALQLLDADRPTSDVTAGLDALRALGSEPADFVSVAAGIAHATVLQLAGPADDVERVMTTAMRHWAALDRAASTTARRTDLDRDVIAIRNEVFRPGGDGIFVSGHGWNAFRWDLASSRHLIVHPELRVKLHDGAVLTVTTTEPFPQHANVLFLDPERRTALERVMVKIGGTKRRAWTDPMQTPNRPAGASIAIMTLWKRYFFVQPGHWGGWVFETYPIINEIEFVDAARSRAAVKVTVGYSGCTVQLVKRDGAWEATELSNFWIT
jgi:hypothetical protein